MAARTAVSAGTREIEGRDSVGLYLDEIARNPLLDAESEVELSKAIEVGLMAEHLLDQGWSSSLVAEGASAGGLLMGAVANQAPELFAGVVAGVPFVDNLTTMLDPSLPLTVTEYDEWGNPEADAAVYDYMASYAPYDNVAAVDYPPILAETSLNDTRVLYVEPAKWIARLRATAVGRRDFLLRTEMAAGHGGVSGRYKSWHDRAFTLAWILDRMGLADRPG